jgi:hypothetical protein
MIDVLWMLVGVLCCFTGVSWMLYVFKDS